MTDIEYANDEELGMNKSRLVASGSLNSEQVADYQRNGFLSSIPVFSAQEVGVIRAEIEHLENRYPSGAGGHELNQFFRVNGHIVIPLLAQIARKKTILSCVSNILGADLLVWSVELFIKEPGTKKVVSWHQDLTYWGMGETDEELTAWIALSDVSIEAGCMRFIPGSHKQGIVDHDDTFGTDNLLSRGQAIGGIDESAAVFGALKPGMMSFHHGRTFHASGPNMSSDRRIGMAIRYVTPHVKQPGMQRDYAMPVQGCNNGSGWINIDGPRQLFDPQNLLLYDEILAAQAVNLAAGAEGNVALYQ